MPFVPRRVLVAGFAATAVITLISMIAPPFLLVTGGPGDFADVLVRLFGGVWLVGLLAHVVFGTVVLPGLYAGFAYYQLSGHPLLRGLEWGLLLWGVMQIAIAPLMGDGFFSALYGGPASAASSLAGHALYGAVLGFGIGRLGGSEPRRRHTRAPEPIRAGHWV